MKKILFMIICIILVFFIYIFNKDDKVLYFKISDVKDNNFDKTITNYISSKKKLEDYILYKNTDNYRVIDLINDIKNNKIIIHNNKHYTINNLLVKSELIVISIGNNDLLYYFLKNDNTFKYINEFADDMDVLLSEIRKKTKENVVILFDYNLDEEYNEYLYTRLLIKVKKYDIKLLNKNNLLKYVKNIY